MKAVGREPDRVSVRVARQMTRFGSQHPASRGLYVDSTWPPRAGPVATESARYVSGARAAARAALLSPVSCNVSRMRTSASSSSAWSCSSRASTGEVRRERPGLPCTSGPAYSGRRGRFSSYCGSSGTALGHSYTFCLLDGETRVLRGPPCSASSGRSASVPATSSAATCRATGCSLSSARVAVSSGGSRDACRRPVRLGRNHLL